MNFFGFLKNIVSSSSADVRKGKANLSSTERKLITESFAVRGVYYYKKATAKLATPNPQYTMPDDELLIGVEKQRRIFKYNYTNKPVILIPEPTNKHDENAIVVSIANQKVGYIASEENEHVRDILKNHEIKSISAFISGGPYKNVYANGDILEGDFGLSATVKIKYI